MENFSKNVAESGPVCGKDLPAIRGVEKSELFQLFFHKAGDRQSLIVQAIPSFSTVSASSTNTPIRKFLILESRKTLAMT